ncbi:hypothetical protein [Pseudonocardia sp. WMMC193]|uniref:hypothetical protein n=1 Tax=Pseudonocardia sp. WMMC193 TaxID=2911965 RepID=UPI001F3113E1|nr:hypothetical protein [Pseudonocardia sp. WMMC193]MCF7548157.1 hypothetical protein [Pseudonocardia sp. WMMC193]
MTVDYQPQVHPDLEGRVVEISFTRSDFTDEPIPVLVISNSDGLHRVSAFHASLRQQLALVNPEVGCRLGIRYVGKRKLRNHWRAEFHAYHVAKAA